MYNIAQGNPPQMPAEDQLSEEGVDFLKRCFERDPSKRSSAAELLQHQWIVEIRRLVVDVPDTIRSDTGLSASSTNSATSSLNPSRQPSSNF
jgi:mitogen-activated protein kinase kinase kinase